MSMNLGQTNALQFEFTPGAHDEALGFGSLRASIGKSPIWTDEADRGIPWTWIDLLEQLACAWPFLKYEESVPAGAYDGALSLLRTGRFDSPQFDFEPLVESTTETYIFLRRHNLATGVEGLFLPSLSLLREGRKMWVASAKITKLLDFEETLKTLTRLGDALAEQVTGGSQQERSKLALAAWKNREPSLEEAVQIQLGSTLLLAETIPPNQTFASYFEAERDDESSLLIAARMSEALPVWSRLKIVDLIRERPMTGITPLLQEVSAEAETKLPNFVQRAHKQGETLAQWARQRFGIAPEAKADPQEVLQRLGVEVTLRPFDTDVIDAVGCWGHRHGPAVLVNVNGKHAQSTAGRRATLAHELAHVLVDRNGSLPAAEVFGGNVPRHPEQRAGAFAAEFLLPKSVAVARISGSTDAVKTIERLRDHFAVSRELAAWQIINSPIYHELKREEQALLKSWTANTGTGSFFR